MLLRLTWIVTLFVGITLNIYTSTIVSFAAIAVFIGWTLLCIFMISKTPSVHDFKRDMKDLKEESLEVIDMLIDKTRLEDINEVIKFHNDEVKKQYRKMRIVFTSPSKKAIREYFITEKDIEELYTKKEGGEKQ